MIEYILPPETFRNSDIQRVITPTKKLICAKNTNGNTKNNPVFHKTGKRSAKKFFISINHYMFIIRSFSNNLLSANCLIYPIVLSAA